MSLTEIVVEGTLKPDGSLELDQKPGLLPGRVTVILRQESLPMPAGNWWQFMQDARKKMEDAGCPFMDDAEMEAHIEWLREEDRIDELLREAGRPQPNPEQP